jgi:hypothetical protein
MKYPHGIVIGVWLGRPVNVQAQRASGSSQLFCNYLYENCPSAPFLRIRFPLVPLMLSRGSSSLQRTVHDYCRMFNRTDQQSMQKAY